MIDIIPSILVKTKEEFIEKLRLIEPLVERVHVDIADGIFVPNKTIDGPTEVEDAQATIGLTAHLMVSKPENHIARWLQTPVDSIVFHIEATQKPQETIDLIKEGECRVGIALNPSTDAAVLADYVDQIDFVHFMTVEPGFYGSDFVPSVVKKISDFHFYYPDLPIIVDGAVTPENATELAEAGATSLVVGSYLFTSKNLEKALEEFKTNS